VFIAGKSIARFAASRGEGGGILGSGRRGRRRRRTLMRQLLIALVLVPFAAAVPHAAAPNPGVVFELEIVSQPGAAPQVVQTAVEGVNARMHTSAKSDVIYRGAQREMLMLDHASKTFTVFDEAAMKKMAATLGPMMAQMEQAMKNMPESQRAQMEQMMKGRMGGAASAPVVIKATNERSTQNGFPTVKHEVTRGGVKIQDIWVTPWSSIDGFKEAQPVFESMAEFFKGMLDSMKTLANDASLASMSQMKDLAGYPVVTQSFDAAGKPTGRTSLKSIKRQVVAASEFEPPAGYKARTMLGM
jgi:hypothetical protein